MKIYISGQITGLPIKKARANFYNLEKRIRALGFEVVNPMKLPHNHSKEWIDYMREDVFHLMDCDVLVYMENAIESKGACIEIEIARLFDIQTLPEKFFFEEWVNEKK